jgi:hypothetical protein
MEWRLLYGKLAKSRNVTGLAIDKTIESMLD